MNRKIFVLDDDEHSCQLAQQALARAGFVVEVQTRAIGATVNIKAFGPDLLLLDVMMPALSGDSLVEILQRALKPCPKILFYSNKSANELRELVERTGVEGYVCKVDGPANLVRKVRQALE